MADTSLVFNLVARDRASGVVERMGERMGTAAATIGAGIGTALGIGVATSLSMDGANAKLANQLGLNETEAARVGKVSGAVFADGFGASVDEVAVSLRGVASSMVDVGDVSSQELQKLTTQAKVLSDTFDYDVSEATKAAGTLMKAGLAADGTEAFDLITAAAQKLPAGMAAEIPAMVSEYASFFDELGVTGPQMMGALTEAAKNPLFEIDKLGDAVKEFNLRIADSGAVAAPLKELGLDVNEIQTMVNQGRGTQAFDQIVVALSKVKNQTDATRLSAALMGGPGEDAKTSLLGLGKAGGFAAIGLDDAAGSTQGLVDRVESSSTATLQKFKNSALTELADVAAGFINFGMANQGAVVPLLATLGTLAAVIMTVSVAQRVYAAYSAIATVATNVMNSSTYRAIAGWTRMMVVGLMAMARIAVASTVSAATTAAAWVGSALAGIGTWIAAVIRAAVTAAAQFLMMAARAVAWAAVMAAQWLIAMGPIGWVIAAIVGLVVLIIANWDRIKAMTAAVWDWIWGKIKGIGTSIVNTVVGFVAGALRAWDRLKLQIALKIIQLAAFVSGLPGKIKNAIGSLGSLLLQKGRDVVSGLWEGIKGMGGWIAGKLIGWAKSAIPGPIAKALGIASPSKVTKAQGQWIAKGLVVGLTGSAKQVKAAAGKLADIVRAGLAPGKKRSAALGKISSGSKQLVALANQEVTLASRIKTATKLLGDQIKARNKLAADVKKGVLDSANITANAGGGQVSAASILATLTAKMQQAKQFAQQLAALKKKGVRSDLIAQIAQAGVEQGSGAAAALATASASEISQINATQAQLVGAATQAGDTAGTAMYGAGIQAANGLIKGLKSQQKEIEKQMASIGNSMAKAIKKALGIHSPSRVFADEVGRWIPAGIMRGMADGQRPLDQAMAEVVQPPSSAGTAAVARQMSPVQAAPLMAGANTTVVRIELTGPEEVKKFIRGIVRKDGRGSVQTAFGTGKG
ncbi:phage tail tape measure protein [Streptomyces sp. NBC_00842]|uniref:phage tail tape measure protein n=1 Tax=Streptomyces sp. NBC_00842 TaxID=2975848 RepID=UPI003869EDFB|nr:phage tail tape measure protein [Streptomyces sp. NBC_00842]